MTQHELTRIPEKIAESKMPLQKKSRNRRVDDKAIAAIVVSTTICQFTFERGNGNCTMQSGTM
jgi:hypothetical protein